MVQVVAEVLQICSCGGSCTCMLVCMQAVDRKRLNY